MVILAHFDLEIFRKIYSTTVRQTSDCSLSILKSVIMSLELTVTCFELSWETLGECLMYIDLSPCALIPPCLSVCQCHHTLSVPLSPIEKGELMIRCLYSFHIWFSILTRIILYRVLFNIETSWTWLPPWREDQDLVSLELNIKCWFVLLYWNWNPPGMSVSLIQWIENRSLKR